MSQGLIEGGKGWVEGTKEGVGGGGGWVIHTREGQVPRAIIQGIGGRSRGAGAMPPIFLDYPWLCPPPPDPDFNLYCVLTNRHIKLESLTQTHRAHRINNIVVST
jgi:hypothetical protein